MNWSVIHIVLDIAVLLAVGAFSLQKVLVWVKLRAVHDVARETSGEWEELASVRAEKITDLEAKVVALAARVAHLEAQIEAMQAIQVEAIADRVVEKLAIRLGFLDKATV
jgi:uncharacterized protein YlxW (UPF0749 family)